MKAALGKLICHEKFVFVVLSVVFAFSALMMPIRGDDLVNIAWTEKETALGIWQRTQDLYFTWSSRQLINFVLYFLTGRSRILFALFMGVSLFVLLTAISALFVAADKRRGNTIAAGLVMLYPFIELGSAGFIATMTTYLSPIAFGMMALVPIRRMLGRERLCWYEMLGYCACLIFGANNEQMMIVILSVYTVFLGYSLFTRTFSGAAFLLWGLSVASCIHVLICPGNYARRFVEMRYIPFFGMFNMIDKLEIGFATTLQWMIVENHVLIICICLLLAYLIQVKYKNVGFTLISILPLGIVTAFHRQLSALTERFIPFGAVIARPIDIYGLVTEANRGGIDAFVKFAVFAVFMSILMVEFVLVANSARDLVISGALLISGFVSRLAVGFSPSVYISGYRTCSIMGFCLIGCVLHAYFSAEREGFISERERAVLIKIMAVLPIPALAKFMYDFLR